jgi:hypothetical protein
MLDKKQGVAKLFQNVIIMLAALILIPSILFGTNGGEGLVSRAQRAFLPMLPRILFGVNPSDGKTGTSTDTLDQAANDLAVAALSTFFMPAQDIDSVCGSGTLAKVPKLEKLEQITDYAKLTCHKGIVSISVPIVGTIGHSQYYIYSYTYVVSLIVGIILVAILVGICLDVAKRVFKLIILEVIAPIPIMSLIDPDSASKGAFAAWSKTLIFTFLDIFIKIGILYLIIMLLQLIVQRGLFTNYPEFSEDPIRTALLTIALILGLLFFAKEAPKFIKDSLGIKDKGDGGGFMGKFAAAAGGGLAGFAAGALHGNALQGMAVGAGEGFNAQPGKPAHAFRAASDKVAQLRTGDDKYKTGFAASLQRWNGRRAGYSNEGLNAIKDRVKFATAKSSELSQAYQDVLHGRGLRANLKAIDGSAITSEDQLYEALGDAQAAQTAGEKQQKAYEAGMRSYGLSTNRIDGGLSGATYRASRAVGGAARAATEPVRDAGRRVRDVAESTPGLGRVVRSIDSAHQQHLLNEMSDGRRANNWEGDKTHGEEAKSRVRDRRDDLDKDGTFQQDHGHAIDTFTGSDIDDPPRSGHSGTP